MIERALEAGEGAKDVGTSRFVAPVAAVLITCSLIGAASIYYSVAIRLPMVAGGDHLLPRWFSRLHPRYKTLVGSIVFRESL